MPFTMLVRLRGKVGVKLFSEPIVGVGEHPACSLNAKKLGSWDAILAPSSPRFLASRRFHSLFLALRSLLLTAYSSLRAPCSLEPRLAQRRNVPLQHRRVSD